MPQIKVLPIELRNKIAAGEVIERPASVVKELIENSIDAGSTEIKIEILQGGKGLIKVNDNGLGMDREDALLSIQPHATSKLKNEADLFNITTMGFRGEALPSIASVSRMKLTSGPRDSHLGTSIEVTGGEVMGVKDSPSHGTSIEIRDLFFNTPARKKFLKSDNTETVHIIDIVTKEALSHHNIGFRLSADNNETIALPVASSVRERLMQIYGSEFVQGLFETESGQRDLKVTAFISKDTNFRNSRTHQFIFINRRPVKDQSVSHAVYKAYEGLLPQDKHPVFFIFIEINAKKIDFNVHPTKREVRFEDKEEVYRFIRETLRERLRDERIRFTKPFSEPDFRTAENIAFNRVMPPAYNPDYSHVAVSENLELMYQTPLPFIYLGETFIATAGRGGLMLIDHHAAHERILYESFLKGTGLNSSRLLFPQQAKLSPKEYKLILDNTEILNEMGIEVDDFGHNSLVIRSLPDALKGSDIRGILSDVASSISEGRAPDRPIKEAIAARIACHSSVRGRDILNQSELGALISDLEKTGNPDQCPHGRPTRIFYSLEDLKKIFKRK